MICVLGSTGYVGNKICEYLILKNIPYKTFSMREKYHLRYFIQKWNIAYLINCSAYVGEKGIQDCELNPSLTYQANVDNVSYLINLCRDYDLTLSHISTGCIFQGNYFWTEDSTPNFNNSIYNNSKIDSEKIANMYDKSFIFRLRIPFDYIDHPKNIISKMKKFDKVGIQPNSLTNINDFARIVVDHTLNYFNYGTFNVVNPGSITFNDIKRIMKERNIISDEWTVLSEEKELELFQNKKSNVTLSSQKIISNGYQLDEIYTSINKCLDNWNSDKNIFWN